MTQAEAAYYAYIAGRGQKLRSAPGKPRKGRMGCTKPKGARLWNELPTDEQDGWRNAVDAILCWGLM